MTWNTTTMSSGTDGQGQECTLWGHNGKHVLRLTQGEVSFHAWDQQQNGWGTPYTSGPDPVNATVSNVTVTDVKTNVNEGLRGCYRIRFIYDPSEEAAQERKTPPFRFKINDGVNQGGYQVVVFMRTTPEKTRKQVSEWPTNQYDQYGGPYIAGVANAPGPWQTEWNGHLGNGQGALVEEPCTYTFDIGVWEAANPYDWSGSQTVDDNQWMKYNYWLWIPETYTAADGSTKPGHDLKFVYDEATEKTKAKISYYFEDAFDVDPNSMAVYLLDGAFNQKAVYTSGQVHRETPYEDVDIYAMQDSDEGGTWRGIFTGIDDHSELRREHALRRMVAVNQMGLYAQVVIAWPQEQAIVGPWFNNEPPNSVRGLNEPDQGNTRITVRAYGLPHVPTESYYGVQLTFEREMLLPVHQEPFYYTKPASYVGPVTGLLGAAGHRYDAFFKFSTKPAGPWRLQAVVSELGFELGRSKRVAVRGVTTMWPLHPSRRPLHATGSTIHGKSWSRHADDSGHNVACHQWHGSGGTPATVTDAVDVFGPVDRNGTNRTDTIYAPFTGTLTMGDVTPGWYAKMHGSVYDTDGHSHPVHMTLAHIAQESELADEPNDDLDLQPPVCGLGETVSVSLGQPIGSVSTGFHISPETHLELFVDEEHIVGNSSLTNSPSLFHRELAQRIWEALNANRFGWP